MTIALLTRTADQKIARPWNTASTKSEALEMLNLLLRARTARGERVKVASKINMAAIGTDEPVLVIESVDGRTEFYAFPARA